MEMKKITKAELVQMIRENMALRMTQDRMRGRSSAFSEPRSNRAAQKRKGNEPITRNHVVKGSFEGTSSDRVKLEKELKTQIEKMIENGKEDQVPSNWRNILSTSNGDQLLALKNAINPGILKKVGRFLGITEEKDMKITKEEIRKIIKEEMAQMRSAQEDQGGATLYDLKRWFLSKKDTVRDLGVPAAQIGALMQYMEDGIEAARAGKLRTASKRLGTMMDKLSGNKPQQ